VNVGDVVILKLGRESSTQYSSDSGLVYIDSCFAFMIHVSPLGDAGRTSTVPTRRICNRLL
jgi:hypothetical protein